MSIIVNHASAGGRPRPTKADHSAIQDAAKMSPQWYLLRKEPSSSFTCPSYLFFTKVVSCQVTFALTTSTTIKKLYPTLIMGFDCGFDICPPLEATDSNKALYRDFLEHLWEKYRGVTDPDSRSPSGIVLITPETRHTEGSDKLSNDTKYFYYFMIGEAPHLPSHPDCCDRFLRFSSKYFGDRVCFWHELRETGDERQYGCYSWNRVYEAEKEVRDFHENMEKQ
ncbi:SET domain-containing 5 [Fusarium albosuccineum]|uniref:SET domain-containing 5 n=1 Tax=Fusarium albosuccineum TaxID=1237068 RepID=A0A8H4LBU2_9HYPO|nr:SET domain-containing 5 [Fusarium albosuccineum]